MQTWKITKDHFPMEGADPGTNGNAIGVMGPRRCPLLTDAEMPHKFRMYDDDGELMYEGITNEVGFAPLDDFGTPNVGCTRIDFWNPATKAWETL